MKFFRFTCLLSLLCSTPSLFAAGMTLHIWMAEKALTDFVEDPELRAMLSEQEASYKSGAIFPDSGYVIGHPYGEFAHWHDFLNQYFQIFRHICPDLSSQQCRSTFAHLLGSLSHSIADVNFDRHFVTRQAEEDHGGDIGKAQSLTDPGCDFLAILEHKRGFQIPESPLPEDVLVTALNQTTELDVRVDQLRNSYQLQKLAIGGEALGSPFTYLFYKSKLRWGSQNYLTARGGLVDSAQRIAHAWQLVWQAYQKAEPTSELFYSEGPWPYVDFYVAGQLLENLSFD